AVTNVGATPANGTWADSVFFSTDAVWDIRDRAVGRKERSGTLNPDGTYTLTLTTTLPSLSPGSYRVIVRTDIFNQVFEGAGDANNATASADTVNVAATPLTLGVPPAATTFSAGKERRYQVTVPAGRTLQVKATAADDRASLEVFVRHGAAPTSTEFDASGTGQLDNLEIAVVPTSEAGVYYVLVRG